MHPGRLAVFALPIALAACSSSAGNNVPPPATPSCEVTAERLEALLALEPHAFDQDKRGWRSVGEGTCNLEAAWVIDAYLVSHKDIDPLDGPNLYFHAGQTYALAGANDVAIARFERAIRPDEPPDTPFHWNAYVRATIAFLVKDRAALHAARAKLDAGDGPNQGIVDGFDKCFDKSYREAYLACR